MVDFFNHTIVNFEQWGVLTLWDMGVEANCKVCSN